MQAITVGTTAVQLAPAGNRDFVHIQNLGTVPIFVCYDGSEGASGVNLTTSSGVKIVPGQTFTLDNVGVRNIYNKQVWGISGTAGQDVRVMGV